MILFIIIAILVIAGVFYALQKTDNSETLGVGSLTADVNDGDTTFNVIVPHNDVTSATSVLIGTEKIQGISVTETKIWGTGNYIVTLSQGDVIQHVHPKDDTIIFYR